jgi:hypothetical protein
MKIKRIVMIGVVLFLASCKGGFDHKVVESDFKKKCPECTVVNIDSQECEDGSVLACYLVTINYKQNSDTVKTAACQYVKGDEGWHLVE